MNLDKRIKIRNLDVLTPSREKFRLRWKEYQILSLLVARSPELVSRTEIIENIWKGTYCSDSTINQTIKSIRQKIGDAEHTLIRTIPRLGYKVENKAVFHFISEEEEYADDEIWGGDTDDNKDIQAELSESNDKPDETLAEEIELNDENMAPVDPPVVPVTLKNTSIRKKIPASAGFFSVPAVRVVKYLSVFVSLLIISHFSYVLGNQTRPPIINDIQNNTRVVLTLTLNNARTNSPQTLLCLYQGESLEQATIECVDPKQGRLKQPVKYETSDAQGTGKINLILPNKTMEYQVAYDVKN
ncbi:MULTISPECIES: winged helix-turn-helix domain-containing protein [Serratia]|uniref:Winged helix-turn-helix domain-containing protein n=1 Tax=Serratia liquefaciens TaxID=614 RepID=A0ABX7D942_SERLI|nr:MULTISPECIES: winged helix-turn-helix domain-containing protein [Serratia]AYO38658.1 helix-turn-helix domain-containing protein [Serratia sp. P2ACOL2]MBI6161670.1 winged helix-turn-helix domain-containing protein [Serratia liquefaciens]MBV0842447.1 winged helix-turn-helix domain-containing protein [Serratia liquefaciens]OKP23245.1 CadC family transcriptional regulator [Serratia liquefaciens]QNQ52667.1 winged helix-turn-helix domain-containing protein [Serratia liquefaciens]